MLYVILLCVIGILFILCIIGFCLYCHAVKKKLPSRKAVLCSTEQQTSPPESPRQMIWPAALPRRMMSRLALPDEMISPEQMTDLPQQDQASGSETEHIYDTLYFSATKPEQCEEQAELQDAGQPFGNYQLHKEPTDDSTKANSEKPKEDNESELKHCNLVPKTVPRGVVLYVLKEMAACPKTKEVFATFYQI